MTVTHIHRHPQQRLMSALGEVLAVHPALPEIVGLAADAGEWTAQILSRGPEDVARLLQWIAVMHQPYVVARRRTASTELVVDGLISGARLRILMLSPRSPDELGVPADAGSAVVPVEQLRSMVAGVVERAA
ncbi:MULTISPECIES: hypothetical protein [unclassified Saccharopolyspora]|uniref:hypothetical protein n=1 Tax=unclassified Saccharopolyspora TaxID=2646250 RepID=UPI001CD1AA10|nr:MULTISPECIES: hypothetical protein [unclassified Saccharopolyspora]MCA1185774.1 hypothetical protein [Saccharopolyspora sp. 6T]MCA1191686.1 hypothetical protein [Saccharopolyspora sp. 6V]